MGNPKVLRYFCSEKNLKTDWFGNKNGYDCRPIDNLSVNDQIKYLEGFSWYGGDILLFVRDTSFFNSGNQGVIITDEAIKYISDHSKYKNDDLDSCEVCRWTEIDNVRYNYRFEFYPE